jgi:hypothetical protein
MKMSTHRVRYVGVGFVGVLYLLCAPPSIACDCDFPPLQPRAELQLHDLVFAGHMYEMGTRRGCGCSGGAGDSIAQFEVTEAFAGTRRGHTVEVETDDGSDAECGWTDAQVDQDWLLFTWRDDPLIHLCTVKMQLGVGAEYHYCDTSLGGTTDDPECGELSESEVLDQLRGALTAP